MREKECQSHVPVSFSNCSSNVITWIVDAKNMYVVGARILDFLVNEDQPHFSQAVTLFCKSKREETWAYINRIY